MYESGLLVAFLIWPWRAVALLVAINSTFERNLNQIGQPQPRCAGQEIPPGNQGWDAALRGIPADARQCPIESGHRVRAAHFWRHDETAPAEALQPSVVPLFGDIARRILAVVLWAHAHEPVRRVIRGEREKLEPDVTARADQQHGACHRPRIAQAASRFQFHAAQCAAVSSPVSSNRTVLEARRPAGLSLRGSESSRREQFHRIRPSPRRVS